MAQLYTYEAQIKVPNGSGTLLVRTRILAENTFKARLLLEQQYGRGTVVGSPWLVK